jgi:hypothetical protein
MTIRKPSAPLLICVFAMFGLTAITVVFTKKVALSSQIPFGQRVQQRYAFFDGSQHIRRELVVGWPTFTSAKYGYTFQYPPDWHLAADESDGSFSVTNSSFERAANSTLRRRGINEIYMSIIKKKPHEPIEAVDKLFALFKDQAVPVTLNSGAEAYRIEFPDDIQQPAVLPPRYDMCYFLPTETAVYFFAVSCRDVCDIGGLQDMSSRFLNSFALISSQ